MFNIIPNTNDKWNAIAVFGYYKVIISFVKYTPQVFTYLISRYTGIGRENQPKDGVFSICIFSIEIRLMDITGGTF